MPSTTKRPAGSYLSNLLSHLRLPLYRNGYSLVFSSLVSSALGMLYWILAARLYPPDVVGLNSAIISTAVFLANVAQLNLTNALNRFLPAAGRSTRRLITISYLISVVLALAAGLIFLLGVPVWAPSLTFLVQNPSLSIGFILCVAAWGIFALQDAALIGLRTAVWVPVENILYSAIKIGLLVIFAAILPLYGVMASWFVPLSLALLMVSGLIFLRLVPRHTRATDAAREPVGPRMIAQYVAGDYIGSLFWIGAAQLQPIMVTELAGATAAAYFWLSWQIAYAFYLISRLLGQSLVAEVAADPAKLNAYSFNILKQNLRLIVPAVAVILLGAPYILHLFGADYSAEASTLLRLLCLSAIPQIIITLYLSIARIQRRMASLIGVQAAVSILGVLMIYTLVPVYGINGIGIAWLASMTLVAGFLAATQLRYLWLVHVDVSLPLRLLNTLRRILWNWGQPRAVADANQMVSVILPNLSANTSAVPRASWNAREVKHTVSDVTVISIGPGDKAPLALLKMSRTDFGAASLKRQSRVLNALHNNSRLGEFHTLVPKLWGEGEIDGRFYVVEELLQGIDGRGVISDVGMRQRLLKASVDTILELYHSTAVTTEVTPDLLRRWIDERLELVRGVHMSGAAWTDYDRGIQRLSDELRTQFLGRRLPISWVHGDFAPGNILVSPDGNKITGIVDWDLASFDEPPMLDIVHLLLSTRVFLEKRELGHVISQLLHGDGWSAEETALLEHAQAEIGGDPVDMRALVLLSWLRHISANLTKSSRFASHTLWVSKNVEVVLGNL